MQRPTRRRFIAGSAVGFAALAGCIGDDDGDEDPPGDDDDDDDAPPADDGDEDPPAFEPEYEIWVPDQGTDTLYVYEPASADEPEFDIVEQIDLHAFDGVEPNDEDQISPHMVSFSSDYAYIAVACNFAGQTIIIETETRNAAAVLTTGPGSHFAGFTPDDEYVHVDVIGSEEIVRIDADTDAGEFEIVDEIAIHDDEVVGDAGIDGGAPICHSYDSQGRSLHTLGPGYGDGALVIVDHDTFEVVNAFSQDELPTNCGTMPHPTEDKFYLTAGMPSDPDEDVDGVGDYYVLDTANDQVLVDGESTEGVDAHGFWFTPDGEELWVLNRETNNGVVVDPETDEVIEEIEAFGPEVGDTPEESDAPDIMWADPAGQYMFVTLRGSNPLSGDPHAATGVNSGFSVLDIDSKEIETVVQPDGDNENSDVHGIGVRPLADFPDSLTSPPF